MSYNCHYYEYIENCECEFCVTYCKLCEQSGLNLIDDNLCKHCYDNSCEDCHENYRECHENDGCENYCENCKSDECECDHCIKFYHKNDKKKTDEKK